MLFRCSVCGLAVGANAMRYGVCWKCNEAESIVGEGLDMYNKGLSNDNTPAITPMDKVRLLVARGCIRRS